MVKKIGMLGSHQSWMDHYLFERIIILLKQCRAKAHTDQKWDHSQENIELLGSTYLGGYILGVLTHTTAWDQLWGGDETERLVLKLYVSK